MSALFAENPRAFLQIPPEAPLLLCLDAPERLDDASLDLAARVLACCPASMLLFCRTDPSLAGMERLSADLPKTLPWQPRLLNSLLHQNAIPVRALVLDHPEGSALFSMLLPHAQLVLDFSSSPAADSVVRQSLRGGIPVVSASCAGSALLRERELAELAPESPDAFVELAVNLGSNPHGRAALLPRLASARGTGNGVLGACPPAPPAVSPPRRQTAADELESHVELVLTAPGRPVCDLYSRGLDLSGQIASYYGKHRAGWEFVTEIMEPLHNPSAPYFESFIERRFAWGAWCDMPGTPLTKPWAGIVHVPPSIPPWFGQENTFPHIMNTENWRISEPYCRGLFTLSSWLRDELRPYTDLPIEVLRHPTDMCVPLWNPRAFAANHRKCLVQVGNTYRNLHAMGLLPPHPLHRLVLVGNSNSFLNLYNQEEDYMREQGLYVENTADVQYEDFVPNNVYDELFTQNVLFTEYYTASASNLIVECMARTTPLLVNRLDPIVEYLGPDYPLYYDNYDEASQKLHGTDYILAAHEYLKTWNRDILDRVTFVHDLVNSEIYKSMER